jgi:hypothetical protein
MDVGLILGRSSPNQQNFLQFQKKKNGIGMLKTTSVSTIGAAA